MKKAVYKKQEKTVLLNAPIQESGMEYTGIVVHQLKKGDRFSETIKSGFEACVVLLSGYYDISFAEQTYQNIGNRMSVFEDVIGYAVYVSQNDTLTLEALSDGEIAVCMGLGKGTYPSRLLEPKEEYKQHRGSGVMQRVAKNILPESDEADSLLIVEVITKGGNWSSFPAHRHDKDDLPNQANLEEIYYHKLSVEEGFALQANYNDDKSMKDAFVIQNNCAVLIKEGYHPVSVPPGVDCYYLNVMAGPKRTWVFHNEPYFSDLNK